MRRSAAPSQVLGNVSKKPRFIPPGKNSTVCFKNETKEMDQEVKLKEKRNEDQNQNVDFIQSVESAGKGKTTKACFSVNKISKVEMKTPNTPKAGVCLPEECYGHLAVIYSNIERRVGIP